MAEVDEEQKTEDPTSKRLEEAREEGQLPISREASTWALFIATLLVLTWLVPPMASRLTAGLRFFLESAHQVDLEGHGAQVALGSVMAKVGVVTFVAYALLAFAVIAGTMAQTGFFFNTSNIKFDVTKLMPVQGFKRLFSTTSLFELFKSFIKMVVLGFVAYILIKPLVAIMPNLIGQNILESLAFLHDRTIHVIIILMLVVTVIAIGDLLYQRHRYFKNLRMSKQEVKDEHKQMEGDPMIKSRLRSIRLERARKRMMAAVPKADVVITNPTHYAVALQYDNTKMQAPVVLAKGINQIAERIRAVAEENKIPLVSNPPLARALYDTVDLDQAIQPAHYRAVAEVISYVYKLKGKVGVKK